MEDAQRPGFPYICLCPRHLDVTVACIFSTTRENLALSHSSLSPHWV